MKISFLLPQNLHWTDTPFSRKQRKSVRFVKSNNAYCDFLCYRSSVDIQQNQTKPDQNQVLRLANKVYFWFEVMKMEENPTRRGSSMGIPARCWERGPDVIISNRFCSLIWDRTKHTMTSSGKVTSDFLWFKTEAKTIQTSNINDWTTCMVQCSLRALSHLCCFVSFKCFGSKPKVQMWNLVWPRMLNLGPT